MGQVLLILPRVVEFKDVLDRGFINDRERCLDGAHHLDLEGHRVQSRSILSISATGPKTIEAVHLNEMILNKGEHLAVLCKNDRPSKLITASSNVLKLYVAVQGLFHGFAVQQFDRLIGPPTAAGHAKSWSNRAWSLLYFL